VARVGAWAWGGSKRARWAAAGIALLVILVWLAVVWFGLGGHDDTDAFIDSRAPPGLAERFYPPENWAWGLIQTCAGPVQRYGVSAPAGTPRAQVLILPDYGESAETWFETARDLNDAGNTVWVLEGVGQGGSARLTRHRDLGDVRRFDDDVAAVHAMIEIVIRPDPSQPLVILGQGQGAMVAARAVETGASPAALVLSAPRCQGFLPDSGALRALGLGDQRAPGASGWRRNGADDFAAGRTHDRWRGAVTHLWQFANPDLRLGGPSLNWLAAASILQSQVRADTGRLDVPTLEVSPGGAPRCLVPSGVTTQSLAGARPALELEDDAHRAPWLTAIEGFIVTRTRAPIPPPLGDHAP